MEQAFQPVGPPAGSDTILRNLAATVLLAVPALLPLSRFDAAIGLLFLAIAPLLTMARRPGELFSEPIVPVSGMWVLAAATPVLLPFLYKDPLWRLLPDSSLDQAGIWMYRAWAACCVTYWGVRYFADARPNRGDASEPADDLFLLRFKRSVGVIGVLGCALSVYLTRGQTYTFVNTYIVISSGATTLQTAVQHFHDFLYAYVFLVAIGRQKLFEARFDAWLFVIAMGVQAIFIVGSGTKEAILAIGAAWALGRLSHPKGGQAGRELLIFACGALFAYCASLLIQAYRFEVWQRAVPQNPTFVESISFQLDAFGAGLGDILSGKSIYGASDLLDRLGHLASFGRVLGYTSGQSPHENPWSSIIAPVYAFLPRNLFPDKPQFADSGSFAHAIGWTYGGFSMTLPGSAYWAWGFFGIPLAMSVLGALLSVLRSWSQGGTRLGYAFKVATILTVLPLLDVGLTFQALMINCTRSYLFITILFYFMKLLQNHREGVLWTQR